MYEVCNIKTRSTKRWRVASIAAALLGAAVLCQPGSAGAMALGGGFPGGGLPGDEFNPGGFGGSQGGEADGGIGGWHDADGYLYGYVDQDGHGWLFGGSDPDYGYNDDSRPSDGQVWDNCSDRVGCHAYLTQYTPASQPFPATGAVAQGDKEEIVAGGGGHCGEGDGGCVGGHAGDGFGGLTAGGFPGGGFGGFHAVGFQGR